MNRKEGLLKLRPKIKTIKRDLNTIGIEKFQNDTIRPILKFQHDILRAIFQDSLTKGKIQFDNLRLEEKEAKLDQLFQKNLSYKNQSIGVVIGMFTKEEYTTYSSNPSSYNRRIVTMLKQRIISTY